MVNVTIYGIHGSYGYGKIHGFGLRFSHQSTSPVTDALAVHAKQTPCPEVSYPCRAFIDTQTYVQIFQCPGVLLKLSNFLGCGEEW